ncbi:unnamed protein product [Citrullus colocynthis]|uniref:Uncharacterized protein n=1 Tax=Citrullus colocynthis TaxID=252529 RepID=A0ABP0Y6P2_9ROSI
MIPTLAHTYVPSAAEEDQVRRHLPAKVFIQLDTWIARENPFLNSSAHLQLTSSTRAVLTNNDFTEGGRRGDPSECDGQFHNNSIPIVALSTGWYNKIKIREKSRVAPKY